MGFRFSGGGCCCEACIQFSDLFDRSNSTDLGGDWTEVSGDAEISGNALTFDAAGVVTNDIVPSQDAYSVITRFTLPADGDKVRIYVGYTDANNHVYVEYERIDSAELSYLAVKVQGGVPTTVLPAQSVPYAPLSPFVFRVTICWDGVSQFLNTCAMASEADTPPGGPVECNTLTQRFVTVTGTYGTGHGIGAVTVDSTVNFSYYELRTPGEEFPYQCPYCNGPCGNCPDEAAPPTMKVVIVGSGAGIDGTYLLKWHDGCLWKTDELDGSGSAPLVTATLGEGGAFTPWGSGTWAVAVSYSLYFGPFSSFDYSWYVIVDTSSPVSTCDWTNLELPNAYADASTGSAFVTT